MIPEITVEELAQKLKSQDKFILLDVREPSELEQAKITDARLELMPLSRLAREGMEAFPESLRSKDAEIYVMCHRGNRSAQVTGWLASRGWTNVRNVSGGIDEFAQKIDPAIGIYY
ncbi:MAG TPA: rhodanese-like domain-containing protein [Anaerolineales bacterium]|nr:rhodanese-like domain-containing protein [Anaerolineales bacterium]